MAATTRPGRSMDDDIAALMKRIDKLERALEAAGGGLGVRDLDQLADCEVLYGSASAPAAGDALIFDPNPDVKKFKGLWKPGWPSVDYFTHSTSGVASGAEVDMFGGAEPPPGLYVASVVIQATVPSDCCGWVASANVAGSGALTVMSSDLAQVGLAQGIWTGDAADSGTWGWQAPTMLPPAINASALALVGISDGGTFVASGTVLAYVLTAPGTGSGAYGSKTCGTTSPDVSITVAARRISPALS